MQRTGPPEGDPIQERWFVGCKSQNCEIRAAARIVSLNRNVSESEYRSVSVNECGMSVSVNVRG